MHYLDEISGNDKVAVELGCGAGRDTIYLIKKGYHVIGIDKNDTEELIRNRLNEKENTQFTFLKSKFGDLEIIEKNDLIVSNYSLSFCLPLSFTKFWRKVSDSIKVGGYFLGNFFGKNDSWSQEKKNMIFFDIEEVKKLFQDFTIIEMNEKEYDKCTAMGKMKHWDVIEVYAKHK